MATYFRLELNAGKEEVGDRGQSQTPRGDQQAHPPGPHPARVRGVQVLGTDWGGGMGDQGKRRGSQGQGTCEDRQIKHEEKQRDWRTEHQVEEGTEDE